MVDDFSSGSYIPITFMFQSYSSSQVRSKYLSLSSFSLIFSLWFTGKAKSTRRQVFYFFKLCLILVSWSGSGDPFVSPNAIEFYASCVILCCYQTRFRFLYEGFSFVVISMFSQVRFCPFVS